HLVERVWAQTTARLAACADADKKRADDESEVLRSVSIAMLAHRVVGGAALLLVALVARLVAPEGLGALGDEPVGRGVKLGLAQEAPLELVELLERVARAAARRLLAADAGAGRTSRAPSTRGEPPSPLDQLAPRERLERHLGDDVA